MIHQGSRSEGRVLAGAAALCVLVFPPVRAAVLHVPSPKYPTIRHAVSAAAPEGDTILVAPGFYPEDVKIASKEITLIGAGEGITHISSLHLTTVPGYENPSGGLFRAFSLRGSFVADRLHRPFTLEDCSVQGDASMDAYAGGEQLHVYDSTFGSDLMVWGTGDFFCEVLVQGCDVAGEFFCWGDDPYVGGMDVIGPASIYGSSACDVGASRFQGGLATSAGEYGTYVTSCVVHGTLEVVNGSYDLGVHDNVVVGGDIVVAGAECRITGNVVRGGTRGIDVQSWDPSVLVIEENTVVGCAASEISLSRPEYLTSLARNIVKGNAVGVLAPEGSNPSGIACNDVYDNPGGNWVGIPDPSGESGNFSLDPLFCDEPEGELTLAANSPCLPGNHPDGADCGRIGARDQGCGVTSDLATVLPGIRPGLRVLGANPTRGAARIAVTLPSAARVSLDMIDTAGREVASLGGGWFPAGRHEVFWDGCGSRGEPLSSGVYFLCLRGVADAPALRLVVLH